jgi:hypothetical protein
MLPDRLSRLLTGFVDGQLSASEEKQALDLLRRSWEARELLNRLQADAQLLAAFPRAQLPPEFREQLQASLPDRALNRPLAAKTVERKLYLRHSAFYAAAASLLLALGIAYLQRPRPTIESSPSPSAPAGGASVGGENIRSIVAELLPAPRPDTRPPATVDPLLPGTATPRPEVLVNMPRLEPDVLTAPLPNTAPFRVYDPKIPLILTMQEMDQPKGQGRITGELAQAKNWRLDLKCQESEVATVRLKRALQGVGIQLLIDPDAADRQRLRFAKTAYTTLLENITQAECVGILTELRTVDRNEQTRTRGNNQFIDLKLIRQSPEDGRHLEDLFGFKVGLRQAVKSVPAEVNSRDVAVMTAARAAAIWRGQNPEGQGAPRHALLVADIVGRVRKPSNENQLFLNSRQPPKPELWQLMIVLTPRKG